MQLALQHIANHLEMPLGKINKNNTDGTGDSVMQER